MQKPACWSRLGRGAVLTAAAAMLPLIGGCSSGVSRFDFPAFNMTSSSTSPAPSRVAYSDPDTTASLPVPPEPIYNSDAHYGSSSGYTGSTSSGVTRASLPAVGSPYSTARPMPASYSPAPMPHAGSSAYSPLPVQPARPQKAAYASEPAAHPEPAVVHTPIETSGTHRIKVEKGDTLASIGHRYGVSALEIQRANNLSSTHLSLGQELVIPAKAEKPSHAETASAAPATYKVQKGDTPHVIAQKLGVDEKELVAKNNLKANRLQIGQELQVPSGGKHEPEATTPAAAEASKPDAPAQEASDTPDVHKVRTTTIPAPGASAKEQPGAKQGAPSSAAGNDKQNAPSQQSVAAAQDVTGEAEDKDAGGENPHVASNDQLPNPDPMSGNSFRWPVQGRIISEFGTKPDGGHNDGIDVAVPQGTPVKAAENGVVAYAGNELKGYGNLVLIRHANNWVSAYAHNDEILVKRGDKVRRGQVIAKAGKTGAVSQPLVHFELRKGSRPVDPTKYMGSAAASAD